MHVLCLPKNGTKITLQVLAIYCILTYYNTNMQTECDHAPLKKLLSKNMLRFPYSRIVKNVWHTSNLQCLKTCIYQHALMPTVFQSKDHKKLPKLEVLKKLCSDLVLCWMKDVEYLFLQRWYRPEGLFN